MGISQRKKVNVGITFGGGKDLNDIKKKDEKRDGKERHECSFQAFRNFKDAMKMWDIKYKEDTYT